MASSTAETPPLGSLILEGKAMEATNPLVM